MTLFAVMDLCPILGEGKNIFLQCYIMTPCPLALCVLAACLFG